MKTKPYLELSDARALVAAGLEVAAQMGLRVCVAVCDDGGHLLALERGDAAPASSASVAPDKAKAAALALKPTKALEDMVNGGRFAALRLPVLPLEGGEMVSVQGYCIGAVGVSGARGDEDAAIARAAIAAWLASAQP